MYQLTVGEFKSKFSEVLSKVVKNQKFKLGSLEGKASFKTLAGFKMTVNEFLKS